MWQDDSAPPNFAGLHDKPMLKGITATITQSPGKKLVSNSKPNGDLRASTRSSLFEVSLRVPSQPKIERSSSLKSSDDRKAIESSDDCRVIKVRKQHPLGC